MNGTWFHYAATARFGLPLLYGTGFVDYASRNTSVTRVTRMSHTTRDVTVAEVYFTLEQDKLDTNAYERAKSFIVWIARITYLCVVQYGYALAVIVFGTCTAVFYMFAYYPVIAYHVWGATFKNPLVIVPFVFGYFVFLAVYAIAPGGPYMTQAFYYSVEVPRNWAWSRLLGQQLNGLSQIIGHVDSASVLHRVMDYTF